MKSHAKASLILLSLLLPLQISCSASSRFELTGNPLLDLRNPELLERDRIAAARAAWAEVEDGIRDRERTRYALKNLAWSGGTERPLRLTVIELLMSDESSEGNADSRAMARLMLPTEKDAEAVRIIAVRAVKSDWDDLVPALVRSLSRHDAGVPDRERIEYLALQELRPGIPIEQIVFDVFLNPGQGGGNNQEVTVLRSLQRTRDEAWGLLGRLDPQGTLRRELISSPASLDAETSVESQQMIVDLRAIQDELGVIPNTAMEIAWLHSLRHHTDPRNHTQNIAWWDEVAIGIANLDANQRLGLRMRHLEPVRWASRNRPAWLNLDREALYAVLNTRLSGRAIYKRKAEKGEAIRQERLGDWISILSWGDLLSILIVDESLQNPVVLEQLFTQRALDRKDTSTEYGGIIETDPDTGWRAVLFRPRQRDRVSDQRFVASDDMFRFSDRALAHYHFHADQRDNTRYAGPSHADQVNAVHSARTSIVLTSMGEDTLGVDVYFDHGAVIDLGRIEYQE